MRFPPALRSPVLAGLSILAPFALPVFAGDTTYSRTEAVPKAASSSYASPQPAGQGPDEDRYGSFESGSTAGEPGDGFMSRCMGGGGDAHSLQDVEMGILGLPIRAAFCGMAWGLWTSHAHLFVGDGSMDDWDDGRWRFGWGFGLGAAFMPATAGGLPLDLGLEATGALSEDWQLRLRSGVFAHLMGSEVDYRREVFVDGKPIGSQRDVMTGYVQSGFPLFADGIRLFGSHGLYLAGGAGLVALHETIDYVRHKSYAFPDPPRQDERWQVLPAMDVGLGRYGGGGNRSFWRFEIRYQAILHRPQGLTSFPGDNAGVTHAVTWNWTWF